MIYISEKQLTWNEFSGIEQFGHIRLLHPTFFEEFDFGNYRLWILKSKKTIKYFLDFYTL